MCIYRNLFKNIGFSQSYKKDFFEFLFDDKTTILSFNHEFQSDFMSIIPGYLARYSIREGNIIIDAGAYLGSFTVFAAKKVGKNGKVIAFEPDPNNFEKLMKNINLNKLKNVIAIKKGLYSTNMKMVFDSSEVISHIISIDHKENLNNYMNIEVITLDEILEELQIDKVDFIKMDVEGAEVQVLQGCRRTLQKNRVNLAIASYHIVNGLPTSSSVEHLLSNWDYRTETGYPKHLTTYAWK